jgi:UDP-N-acetylglucosamine diphosphorylase/glucosamine-1-phosphate N-acetyltransferase
MKILLYEDTTCEDLYPLNLLRGTFDVKCGAFSTKERIEFLLNKKVSLNCRERLTNYLKEIYAGQQVNEFSNDDYLFINSRVLILDDNLDFLIKKMEKDSVIIQNKRTIAAKISKNKISIIKNKFLLQNNNKNKPDKQKTVNLKRIEIQDNNSKYPEFKVLEHSFDTIKYIDDLLPYDLNLICKNKKSASSKNKNFINSSHIFIEKNVNVSPFTVLDATEGNIYIDKDTRIEPFSYLKGPLYIGNNCIVKSGTKIYGPCYIGKQSRVSGEISHSIFHSYINKQHDGFIGHTYASEFVNFGADTVTSNLKNNYSFVSVDCGGKKFNTGMQFLGSIVGDHTKFGINTMLNTGTMIGIFANIAGGGFPDKFINSFSWYILGKENTKYKLEEALRTARTVMSRRDVKMSPAYEELVKFTYDRVKF